MKPEIRTDVAIIGAGSAGLYAMREVRQAGRSFVLIDHGPLGTTCARVGCMPSKVALHAGAMWAARKEIAGVGGLETLSLDTAQVWAALRKQRDQFASRPAKAARSMAGEFLLEGPARFREPGVLEVRLGNEVQIVRAGAVVIATGSRPVLPKWLAAVAGRTVTTDQLFELPSLPKRVGVLGLGAIGLEMGLALSRLGVEVIGADVANMVAGIVDPVIGERAIARFGREITLWLGSEVSVSVSASGEEVLMRSGDRVAKVDLLLAALGRRPNVDSLNLEAAGIAVDARGMPEFDPATMRIGDFPVFIAGDANGDRPLMHEAADEGAIAGYNAARADVTRFRRKVALGIAFADPDVVSVGARLDQLDPQAIAIGSAGGDSNGRAKILGSEESLLRLYADARDGRLLGAALVATGGEHLAHLLAWAIQRGETVQSLLQLPFYHPVVEEMLQTALKEIAQKFPDGLPSGLARA